MKRRVFVLDKNLAIIFGVTVVTAIGISAVAPALPKIASSLDISRSAVGLLFTYYTLPIIFLAPLTGILSDRIGRKPVLIYSLIFYGIVGLLITQTSNYTYIVVLRFLQGVGVAALINLNIVLIGDLFMEEARLETMGFNSAVLNVAAFILPAAGGALALLGWYYPFYLSIIPVVVGVSAFSLDIEEPKRARALGEYFRSIAEAALGVFAIGIFIASAVSFLVLYGAILTYYPLFLALAFRATSFQIGVILAFEAITGAVSSFLIGRLSGFATEQRLVQISFVLLAIALFMIPFSPEFWFSLIPSGIFGVGFGMVYPALVTLATGLAPIEHRAAVTAFNTSMIALGETIGVLLAGLVFTLSGFSSLFYAAAALSIIEFFVAIWMLRGTPRRVE